MALVSDIHDSQGMFSKAGRFTSEKYIVFQKKEEIMQNKPRQMKSMAMSDPPEKKETPVKPQLLVQQEKQIEAAKLKDPIEKRLKVLEHQPFTKQTSREKLAKLRVDQNQPPPCGYYNPKYLEIDNKPHNLFEYTRSQQITSSRLTQTASAHTFSSVQPSLSIPDRMRKTNTCLYELSKQLPRGEDLFKGTPSPHEKRFEFLEIGDNWSKIPRTPQVPMEKTLSRDQMIIYKKKSYAPDYQPNFEYGRKQLGSCGAEFKKGKKRGDIFFKKVHYTNETYFEFDKYIRSSKSQLFPKQIVPNFSKMLDREQDSKCILPSFMQKFVNSRLNLGVTHQKMLELNNFKNGRFQTTTTSFGKYKATTKRKVSVSDDEDDYEMNEN